MKPGISDKATVLRHFDAAIQFEPNTGCWLWARPQSSDGYGIFGYRPYSRRAHRAAWELHVGDIPPGQVVRHRCHTPLCVNPAHLVLGSQAQNVDDMWSSGRRIAATHCPRGHEFSHDNTYVRPGGERECRACRRLRKRGLAIPGRPVRALSAPDDQIPSPPPTPEDTKP